VSTCALSLARFNDILNLTPANRREHGRNLLLTCWTGMIWRSRVLLPTYQCFLPHEQCCDACVWWCCIKPTQMGTTNASLSPQASPLRRHQTPTAVAVCTHGMLWQAIVYKDLSQGLGNMPYAQDQNALASPSVSWCNGRSNNNKGHVAETRSWRSSCDLLPQANQASPQRLWRRHSRQSYDTR